MTKAANTFQPEEKLDAKSKGSDTPPLVAPTNKGKGNGYVIPHPLNFDGPVVLLDLSEEKANNAVLAFREKIAEKTLVLSPSEFEPIRYVNPLERIAKQTNAPSVLTAAMFFLFGVVLTFAVLLRGTELALAAIDFSKAEKTGQGFIDSLRGNLAGIIFTLGFVITGFLASFNRISWMWVWGVVLGAFLVFAAPTLVASLRSSFG